jgi:uncharacterized protein (TIGR00299 family) protein
MQTLYLDIFSGISGDMLLAALVDLGVDARRLEMELAKLGLDGYRLHVWRGEKSGIAGVKFDVHLDPRAVGEMVGAARHSHTHDYPPPQIRAKTRTSAKRVLNVSLPRYNPPGASVPATGESMHTVERDFTAVSEMIMRSPLSDWVKQKSVAVFRRIAVAEGKIHGKPPERVHFHEVGAVDSIVDIVGVCIALEMLGKPRVLAAPVQEGTGWVKCAHGRFPVPAPATLSILGERGVPVTQCDEPNELVTPTGAALLAEFAEDFGPMRDLRPQKIGVGLGTRDNQTRPNVLRAVLGDTIGTAQAIQPAPTTISGPDWEIDTVAVLETNLDDINAELLGAFVERALTAGALDVFHTPIQMKKSRPGVLLTVLCPESESDRFIELMLRETTAFGVRRTLAQRRKLRREFVEVATPFGVITVKLGRLNGKVIQSTPEFESCREAAEKNGVPLKSVYEAAFRAVLK